MSSYNYLLWYVQVPQLSKVSRLYWNPLSQKNKYWHLKVTDIYLKMNKMYFLVLWNNTSYRLWIICFSRIIHIMFVCFFQYFVSVCMYLTTFALHLRLHRSYSLINIVIYNACEKWNQIGQNKTAKLFLMLNSVIV